MKDDETKRIVREGYDAVSEVYEATFGENSRIGPVLKFLEDRIPSGGTILDLGCGSGVPMARSLASRYTFTGVDLSPIQIERARQVAPKSHFVCADMTKVDFGESSFDAIIAMWSIIHLPLDEQPALFKSIAQWLVPNGIFVATLGDGAWTGIEDDWLGVQGSPMYFSHADAPTYKQWLLDAGLNVIEEGFISEPTGECRHSVFFAERSS